MYGTDPVIRSPHRLGEAACTAQLLVGAAGAAIWEVRGGTPTGISMDIIHGLHHLHPTHYIAHSGYPSSVGAEYVAVNGIFQARDGRYVMLEAGPPYQKLLNGYLNFFDCGNSKQSFAREVAKWNAEDLEQALTDAGLPACRAFTLAEWLAHPQGRALAGTPPIEIVKIADGDPVPFRDHADSPLAGVRVLDFTHVLAGPPKFSPVFYLADLMTGYFAAAGMMAALHRRAVEGGSYQVKLSLARSAMWVQELGLLDAAAPATAPETDSYPAETVSIDTAYGAVTSLAPPLTFTNLTLPATDRLVPYGADPASWPSETASRVRGT